MKLSPCVWFGMDLYIDGIRQNYSYDMMGWPDVVLINCLDKPHLLAREYHTVELRYWVNEHGDKVFKPDQVCKFDFKIESISRILGGFEGLRYDIEGIKIGDFY